MKRFFGSLLVAILGGALTLGAYKLFIEKPAVTADANNLPVYVPTVNHSTTNNVAPLTALDFTGAVAKTVNAVVHVKNTSVSTSSSGIFDFFYGKGSRQEARVGTGSGVVISPDGYIITNNHVIENSRELEVTTNDNKTYKAVLVGTDTDTDIALLKIESEDQLTYITFGDSDNTNIGEWVLAIGNPFNLTSTVTAGIISAKARDLFGDQKTQSFIQTDAAVNPGNSGGALVNTNGELVGINTAITSQTGSYVGYSFAVPSNIARKVVEDILEYGNVQEGMLGITGSGLNSLISENLGITETEGFYVASVEEDSGAEIAGIDKGDIIKSIDDVYINKYSDLAGYLKTKRPGEVVEISYLREGRNKKARVKLTIKVVSQIDFYGLQLKNLNKREMNQWGEGVKVLGSRSSAFSRYGIESGYIVRSINDEEITSVKDVKRFLDSDTTLYKMMVTNNQGETERYIFN